MTSPADQLGRFCEYGNTDDAKQKKHYKTENKTTPNKIKPGTNTTLSGTCRRTRQLRNGSVRLLFDLTMADFSEIK